PISDHCGQLRIGGLELFHEPCVDHDLSTGHAVGIHVFGRLHVDFPIPLRRIGAEHSRVRNEPLGDPLHSCVEFGIGIERTAASCLVQLLSIRLLSAPLDLLSGYQHELLALNPDRAGLRGLHRLARRAQQSECDEQYSTNSHGRTSHTANDQIGYEVFLRGSVRACATADDAPPRDHSASRSRPVKTTGAVMALRAKPRMLQPFAAAPSICRRTELRYAHGGWSREPGGASPRHY